MKYWLLGFACYGFGFFHANSDSKIMGCIALGAFGYFIATSIYEFLFETK